jgi:hypothetical protein
MKIVELAPHVCPTRHLPDPVGSVEGVEPGLTIRLQGALEVLQMGLGILALAVWGVGDPHGGRRDVPHVGPQPALLGFPLARRQDRHRGVVGMQLQPRDQGAEQAGGFADPVGQGRARQVQTFAGINFRLPVARGKWSANFETSTCASQPGPASLWAMGWLGAGTWTIRSHRPQAHFGRT